MQLFSVVAFTYDGNDNTVQDIQLLPPHAPSCNFSLASDSKLNEIISVASFAGTTFQWIYSGKTLYQKRAWYGQTIFGFLDISSDEFNFGDGFSAETLFQYTNSGTFVVKHLVVNTYMLDSECERSIRVHYRTPIGGLSFSNSSPIVDELFNVTASIQDIDSRITRISHKFDSLLVENNMNKTFQYSTEKPTLGTYIALQEISWNDGFQDMVLNYSKNIVLSNQPPQVEISITNDDDSKEIFIVDVEATDVDGIIENICWQLMYMAGDTALPDPFFRCDEPANSSYKEIYSECDKDKLSQVFAFSIPGRYKIVVTATDNYGDTGFAEEEFIVTTICDSVFGECPECPDYSGNTGDCYEEIRQAVEECVRNHKDLVPSNAGSGVILVQDGRAANIANGKVGGSLSGKISQVDLIASMTKKISGSISSSRTTGSVSGTISGKVKK